MKKPENENSGTFDLLLMIIPNMLYLHLHY